MTNEELDRILARLRAAEDRLCDLYARVDTGLDRVAAQIDEMRGWVQNYTPMAHIQIEPPPKRPWYTRGAWPYIVGLTIGLAILAYLHYMVTAICNAP